MDSEPHTALLRQAGPPVPSRGLSARREQPLTFPLAAVSSVYRRPAPAQVVGLHPVHCGSWCLVTVNSSRWENCSNFQPPVTLPFLLTSPFFLSRAGQLRNLPLALVVVLQGKEEMGMKKRIVTAEVPIVPLGEGVGVTFLSGSQAD